MRRTTFLNVRTSAIPRPTTVVVVALDCVRSLDFPGGPSPVPGLRAIEELRLRSVEFTHAVSPSPWTLPAHASMFTGRLPWRHGVHSRRALHLSSHVPHIAESLSKAGYATLCIAANDLLRQESGLLRGFDTAAWAESWETYIRCRSPESLPRGFGNSFAKRPPVSPQVASLSVPLYKALTRGLLRFPGVLQDAGQVISQVRGTGPHVHPVAPWIERGFDAWAHELDPEQPGFAFVNLMDAHEPYFPQAAFANLDASASPSSVPRQDALGWLAGRWTPSPKELARLRTVYRHTFERLDRRVGSLVASLKASGRWDSTLFVLTADHGQSFGEEGYLFHNLHLGESVLRVPMLLRLPSDAGAGTVVPDWVSLTDLPRTIASLTGVSFPSGDDGVDLLHLEDSPRRAPVMSLADGLPRDLMRSFIPEDRVRAFDRVRLAGYLGPEKMEMDAETGEAVSIFHSANAAGSEQGTLLREELARVRARLGQPDDEVSRGIEGRLSSWGYI